MSVTKQHGCASIISTVRMSLYLCMLRLKRKIRGSHAASCATDKRHNPVTTVKSSPSTVGSGYIFFLPFFFILAYNKMYHKTTPTMIITSRINFFKSRNKTNLKPTTQHNGGIENLHSHIIYSQYKMRTGIHIFISHMSHKLQLCPWVTLNHFSYDLQYRIENYNKI